MRTCTRSLALTCTVVPSNGTSASPVFASSFACSARSAERTRTVAFVHAVRARRARTRMARWYRDAMDPWSVLSAHQAPLAKAFLADREGERTHLVIYLSGAH